MAYIIILIIIIMTAVNSLDFVINRFFYETV